MFCQLCVRDYQGVDLLLLRRRGTPLEANACPTVTRWTFADPKRLSGMIEEALYSSSHAPASPRGVARKDSGQQKAVIVPESTREKVRERILTGLQKNCHLSSSQHDLAQIAAECEDTCYSNSKSK